MDVFKLSAQGSKKSHLTYQYSVHVAGFEVSQMSLEELLYHIVFQAFPSPKEGKNKAKLNRLLKNFPTLYFLEQASLEELIDAGLTAYEACSLKSSIELGKRCTKVENAPLVKVTNSADVYRYLSGQMSTLDHEQFVVLFLNAQNKIIKDTILSAGCVREVSVNIAKIVELGLRLHSSFSIFVHNHPSGVSKPSFQDRQFTKKLVAYGEIVNIQVLDHIIIGASEYFSFLDAGLIKKYKESYARIYDEPENSD